MLWVQPGAITMCIPCSLLLAIAKLLNHNLTILNNAFVRVYLVSHFLLVCHVVMHVEIVGGK